MSRVFLALLPLLFAAQTQASPCDFYALKARELGCSSDNYLVKFGYRYCRVFEKRQATFSLDAQPVLERIRSCLMLAMDEANPTCESTEEIGFGSHLGCYVENGFCEMSQSDKLHILWVVRSQILNPKFRRVARAIDRACKH